MARASHEIPVPKLLASSVTGTTLLIMIQLASRVFTFATNQLILREISPKTLGIAAQLELYLSSVLYFSRESIRTAIQRQPSESFATTATKREESSEYNKSNSVQAQSGALQSVVNISYLCLGIGIPLALIFASFYSHLAPKEVSELPFFQTSLITTGIASILELGVEPFFAVVQQCMLYRTRAVVEMSAAFLKALSLCSISIWAAWAGYDLGVLPFALSYLSHSLALLCGYAITMLDMARKKYFSFLLTPIRPSGGLNYVADRFSFRLMSLSATVFFQTVVKHILTQGDSLILAAMSSLEDQGIYSLASNYGGLIARVLFQPMEESSRNLFSTLLAYNEINNQNADCVDMARSHLVDVLQAYWILSIIVFPLGPVIVPLTLRFWGTDRWNSPKVEGLLSLYCYYVPFLAFNGIAEAFVSSAATPSELRSQAGWMGGFSACFALAAYIFLKLGGLGAQGLVLANIVNMAVRILWSYFFIKSYFGRHKNHLGLADVSLHLCSYLAGVITTSVLLSKRVYVATNLHSTIGIFIAGVAYILLM